MFLETYQGFAETLKVNSCKNDLYFFTDGVRVKVPSFQKFRQFLQYKMFHRDIIRLNFGLFEDQHYQLLDHRNSALKIIIWKAQGVPQ